MKSRRLHVSALLVSAIVACKTGGGPQGASKSQPSNGVALDPAQVVGEMDGQKITYGDLQNDKEIGPKATQAEVKALTELYDTRRGLLEELISRRLLEGEAKAKGKTLDQWFATDYAATVPEPSEDELKAFYEEHKAQIPAGRTYEDLKPQIVQAVKQLKARASLDKMLTSLKEQHHVTTTGLVPPELPRIKVDAKGPARGPEAAPVTIVEFSDFQCPYCGREVPVVEKVMKDYGDKVRLVFRNFPLEFHPFAAKAAEAGACAADQGKFWPMHDKMFANQEKLSVEDLKGYAKALGVDSAKFDKCLDAGEKKDAVAEDQKAGAAAGVNGTPAFFVNGIFINGAQPYEQFKQAIDRELNKKG
jgi:protein-disulfide isomerase